MIPADQEELAIPVDQGNGGILALAEAVDDAQLSLEETGAAEELLALASEASLSSPINRESGQTPLDEDTENSNVAESQNTQSTSTHKHVCSNCAATSTPFWRKSPTGQYYCNACGLYLRTHNSMRPLSLSKNRESRRSKMRPEACGNCGAADTPMWRKTEDGMVVCNACGLYHKLHGQHRRVGSKRSSSGNSTGGAKPVKTHDFTMVNKQVVSPAAQHTAATTTTKYSLDTQFHHKFDPTHRIVNTVTVNDSDRKLDIISTSTNTSIPVVEVQPVDSRKLAYLKCSQGRTALIAPKLSPIIDATPPPISTPSPSMPPILANFINSLASTSPENLDLQGMEHPLQPLLTSIVSQKLKEQKSKGHHERHHQHQQQQQYLQQQQEYYAQNQDGWPVANSQHLAEFIQNQMTQQAFYQQQQQGTEGYAAYHHNNPHNHHIPHHQQHIPYQYHHHIPPQQLHQHQQHYSNYQNNQPYDPNAYTHPINHQNYQQQIQQQQFFTEQFPDPPLRQLSPFSGIKFDKNLIDLVNLQFWQDSNNTKGSNHDNSANPFEE